MELPTLVGRLAAAYGMRGYCLGGWAALLGVGLLANCGASAQVAFANGGFESGTISGWTYGVTSGGESTHQSVSSIDIDGPGLLGNSLAAHFSAGRITGSGIGPAEGVTLTQLLSLQAGEAYTFEFDWGANLTISSNAEGGIFALMVNTTELMRQAAGSTSSTTPEYGHVEAQYIPTVTGLYSVGVWILRPWMIPGGTSPTLFQSVDNFVVTTAVPEPTSIALLGLGGLLLARRCRA